MLLFDNAQLIQVDIYQNTLFFLGMHNVTVATILTIVVVFVLCSMFLYWKWRKQAKCFKQNIFNTSKSTMFYKSIKTFIPSNAYGSK